ncbi:MUR3 [Mytilus coruscus]|uniref:MUR3 n=1 Tax=Mytilus coruscus TaxID=42192 RepID=A0A6J8ALY7_MYTCO|nr:MUR3 [Mytilus coruscus]
MRQAKYYTLKTLAVISVGLLMVKILIPGMRSALDNKVIGNQIEPNLKNNSPKEIQESERSNENINKQFKFFIYDLPSTLNKDIITCVIRKLGHCYDLLSYGYGTEMFRTGKNQDVSVRNTNQFSLEVIMHNKLLHNRLRTMNMFEADMFYIPAYLGLMFFCNRNENEIRDRIQILKRFLAKSDFFLRGLPHFSSTAKIEREMNFYLKEGFTKNITFLGIEKQRSLNEKTQLIVVPYPSYLHHDTRGQSFFTTELSERDIFILLPVGQRRSNPHRAKLMDQFGITTKMSYSEFKSYKWSKSSDMVLFYTNECDAKAIKNTIPWMLKSVFCLQPPGDSPTRKSFYDAILSGCIPVILTEDHYNPYPFQRFFKYNNFSVLIPLKNVTSENQNIYTILRRIKKSEIERLHHNIRQVARFYQYSFIERGKFNESDALHPIFAELSYIYNLNYSTEFISIKR